MKIYKILFLCLTGAVTACTSNNSNTSTKDSAATDSVAQTSVAVEIKNDTTETVYSHYTKLKDALVESDIKRAAAAGKDLSDELTKMKGCEHASSLAKMIGESGDIKQQRKDFITLNSDLMGVIKNAPVSAGSIYMVYCPMANEGKGAYWFSSYKEIKNPYYGKDMLTCGEVKEEIKQ